MSTSRLTLAPTRFFPKVVTCFVCGIKATSKVSACTFDTVRLIPSTVTEPLYAMYRLMLLCIVTRIKEASPSSFHPEIVATSSTCPSTRCPPNLSFNRSGRSRLTRSPTLRSPNVVRRSVSADISAANVSGVNVRMVRQTPSTAILSPIPASVRTSLA